MKLIDADALKKDIEYYEDNAFSFLWNCGIVKALECVKQQPTIGPENLPIVRKLREELAQVTAERDAAVDVDKAILWLQKYSFNDSEKVYTNGSRLVPYYRVLQALQDKAYNGLQEG